MRSFLHTVAVAGLIGLAGVSPLRAEPSDPGGLDPLPAAPSDPGGLDPLPAGHWAAAAPSDPGGLDPLPAGPGGSSLLGQGEAAPAAARATPGTLVVKAAEAKPAATAFVPRLREDYSRAWTDWLLVELLRWRNSGPGVQPPRVDPAVAVRAIPRGTPAPAPVPAAKGGPAPAPVPDQEAAYFDALSGWVRQARLWTREARRALAARDGRRALEAVGQARRYGETYRREALKLVVFLETSTQVPADLRTGEAQVKSQTPAAQADAILTMAEEDFAEAEEAYLLARGRLSPTGPDGRRRPLTTEAAWAARRALRNSIRAAGEALGKVYPIEGWLGGVLGPKPAQGATRT